MSESQSAIETEEDRSAFRYGAQIANEEIFKRLIMATLALAATEDERKTLLGAMKESAQLGVVRRLSAANCEPKGIEHVSASDIIDSVFDNVLT